MMSTETVSTHTTRELETNWQFLHDELSRLRLLLLREALWEQARLEQPGLAQPDFFRDDPEANIMTAEIGTLSDRCQNAMREHELPIDRLSMAFGIDPFETHVLLMGLAVELDSTFETLFLRTQQESGARLPTVALALRLYCESAAEWVKARASFSSSAPLIRWGLIHLDTGAVSLLSTVFQVDQRISNVLLGGDVANPPFAGHMEFVRIPTEGVIRKNTMKELTSLVRSSFTPDQQFARRIINIHGTPGVGRRTIAALACAEVGLPVLAAHASELCADNNLASFLRESILQNAVAFLDCSELSEENRATVTRACGDGPRLILIGTVTRAAWLESHAWVNVTAFEVPAVTVQERQVLWRTYLGDMLNGQTASLAAQFPFTPGDIKHVAALAMTRVQTQTTEQDRLSMELVWKAARMYPHHRLSDLARRIEARYNWEDIVLPDTAQQQLIELQNQVAHQTRVYEEWGFGKKSPRGRGVSALFSGPSGTGKTMAAEIIAGSLNLELYRIDLSCVVSKYIGETEKNLAKVFDEAERSSVILFFDEADALFGKRSEVKDAHDRYANIEVNYLLQRMEDYQGLAILATNMRQALDEAFLRRLRFLVEFAMPDFGRRLQIWQRSLPPEMPRTDLDIEFLARQFKITGGNIHNIVLNAAFLAAAENTPLHMHHIIHATKREFDKIGKPCLEAEFGNYFALVR